MRNNRAHHFGNYVRGYCNQMFYFSNYESQSYVKLILSSTKIEIVQKINEKTNFFSQKNARKNDIPTDKN